MNGTLIKLWLALEEGIALKRGILSSLSACLLAMLAKIRLTAVVLLVLLLHNSPALASQATPAIVEHQVRVVVSLPDGGPASARKLSFLCMDSSGSWRSIEGTSNEDGVCCVSLPTEGELRSISVFDRKRIVLETFLELGSREETEIHLRLPEYGSVSGSVRTADGRGVGGAHVLIKASRFIMEEGAFVAGGINTLRADDCGNFSVDGIIGTLEISASSSEYSSSYSLRIDVCEGEQATDAILPVDPVRAPLSVDVLGPDGNSVLYPFALISAVASPGPVPSGFVLREGATYAPSWVTVRGRANPEIPGRYILEGLPDAVCQVTVIVSPLEPWVCLVGPSETRITANVGTHVGVSGLVSTPGGQPIPGAIVTVGLPYIDYIDWKETRSLPDGTFSLALGRESGNAFLLATADGHAMIMMDHLSVSSGMDPVDVVLPPELVATGYVLEEELKPVPDAQIRLRSCPRTSVGVQVPAILKKDIWEADASGKFQIRNLAPGCFHLEVVRPDRLLKENAPLLIAMYSERDHLTIMIGNSH